MFPNIALGGLLTGRFFDTVFRLPLSKAQVSGQYGIRTRCTFIEKVVIHNRLARAFLLAL